jgi:hypothetical protein
MTALDLLTIGVIFLFGVITGVILLVSFASLREDRRARLSREAPDRVTSAGRYLTGLYVSRPGDDRSRRASTEHDRRAEFSGPPRYSDPEPWPGRPGSGAAGGPGPDPGPWSQA